MNNYQKCVCLVLMIFMASVTLVQAQTQPDKAAPLPASPCSSKADYSQFDFWVGEWDVTDQGQKIATSSIQRIVEGCIVLENYFQRDGYTGKSINFFDSTLGKWRQTWVDRAGNVGEFSGLYSDGAMRFEGETHRGKDGSKVLRRMTLFNLGADRVRQFSQVSTDNGKTWTVNYDFIYIRKK